MFKKPPVLLLALALVAGLGLAAVAILLAANRELPRSAEVDPNAVVVTVNGAPILERDLQAAMPGGSFDMTAVQARRSKLTRLISELILAQFLKANDVSVAESDVDAEVEALKKDPPPAGCPCCRFASLDQYLAANYMDMAELRATISGNLGFDKYMRSVWESDFPAGEKRDALVAREKPRVMKQYARLSHIMFRTVANAVTFFGPPDRQEVIAKANDAYDRLRKGADFAALAREVSEDAMSTAESGELGFIRLDTYGAAFANAAMALAPGEYSKPVESQWGIHIIRRETATDDDVAKVVSQEYIDAKSEEVMTRIQKSTVVREPGAQSAAAVAY